MREAMKTIAKLIFAVACAVLTLGGLPGWALAAAHPQNTRPQNNGSAATAAPGYLGVNVRVVNGPRAAALGMKAARGTEIVNVDHDAPAGKVGLRVHDVILAINGEPVRNEAQLRAILQGTTAGQTVRLRIYRNRKVLDVPVQLSSRAQVAEDAWPGGSFVVDEMPELPVGPDTIPMPFPKDFGPNVNLHEFAMLGSDGLDVEPLSRQLAKFFGAPKGMGLLVRNVARNSPASSAGLKAGDVITAANGLPVTSLQAWLMVVSQNQGNPVKLRILRNHRVQTLSYTPGGHGRQSLLQMEPEENVPSLEVPAAVLEEMREVAPELEKAVLALERMRPVLVERALPCPGTAGLPERVWN
jgi:membrane-associated protease RseP (regulator of RpoE activity)